MYIEEKQSAQGLFTLTVIDHRGCILDQEGGVMNEERLSVRSDLVYHWYTMQDILHEMKEPIRHRPDIIERLAWRSIYGTLYGIAGLTR